MDNQLRIQQAPQGKWLIKDFFDNEGKFQSRAFVKEVSLGKNSKEWEECTEEEKEEWINSHKEDYHELFEEENTPIE
jgi:hypothetical protein